MKKTIILLCALIILLFTVSCRDDYNQKVQHNDTCLLTDEIPLTSNDIPSTVERVVYMEYNEMPSFKTEQSVIIGKSYVNIDLGSLKKSLTYVNSQCKSDNTLYALEKDMRDIDLFKDDDGQVFKFYSSTGNIQSFGNFGKIGVSDTQLTEEEYISVANEFIKKHAKDINVENYRITANIGSKYCQVTYSLNICGYATRTRIAVGINSDAEVIFYVDTNCAVSYEYYINRVTNEDIQEAIDYLHSENIFTAADKNEKYELYVGNDGYLYVNAETFRTDNSGNTVEGLSCYVRVIPSK